MSFEKIEITRKIPVINGFVVVPEALERNRNALTLETVLSTVANADLKKLEPQFGGGHKTAGVKFGTQEFIETPGVAIVDSQGNVVSGTVSSTYNSIKELVS